MMNIDYRRALFSTRKARRVEVGARDFSRKLLRGTRKWHGSSG